MAKRYQEPDWNPKVQITLILAIIIPASMWLFNELVIKFWEADKKSTRELIDSFEANPNNPAIASLNKREDPEIQDFFIKIFPQFGGDTMSKYLLDHDRVEIVELSINRFTRNIWPLKEPGIPYVWGISRMARELTVESIENKYPDKFYRSLQLKYLELISDGISKNGESYNNNFSLKSGSWYRKAYRCAYMISFCREYQERIKQEKEAFEGRIDQFLRYAKMDIPFSKVVKGKNGPVGNFIVIDADNKKIHDFHFTVPNTIRAKSPEDVGIVILSQESNKVTKHYNDGSAGREQRRTYKAYDIHDPNKPVYYELQTAVPPGLSNEKLWGQESFSGLRVIDEYEALSRHVLKQIIYRKEAESEKKRLRAEEEKQRQSERIRKSVEKEKKLKEIENNRLAAIKAKEQFDLEEATRKKAKDKALITKRKNDEKELLNKELIKKGLESGFYKYGRIFKGHVFDQNKNKYTLKLKIGKVSDTKINGILTITFYKRAGSKTKPEKSGIQLDVSITPETENEFIIDFNKIIKNQSGPIDYTDLIRRKIRVAYNPDTRKLSGILLSRSNRSWSIEQQYKENRRTGINKINK